MTIPKNVINPFSEKFLETWELWKYWRKNEHDGFVYKGVISEQCALKDLVEVSGGDEEKAIKIVEQSMHRGWAGFFVLRNKPKKDTDGKSGAKQKQPNPKETGDSLRDQATAEFNRRNGGREEPGDSTHLKAV